MVASSSVARRATQRGKEKQKKGAGGSGTLARTMAGRAGSRGPLPSAHAKPSLRGGAAARHRLGCGGTGGRHCVLLKTAPMLRSLSTGQAGGFGRESVAGTAMLAGWQ